MKKSIFLGITQMDLNLIVLGSNPVFQVLRDASYPSAVAMRVRETTSLGSRKFEMRKLKDTHMTTLRCGFLLGPERTDHE